MTIRIAHLSDIHFGDELTEAAAAVPAVLADFAPDLTVITGDLTLSGRRREFIAAAAWLAALPGERLVTPGNHDTPYWNLVARVVAPFARYRRHIGPPEAARFERSGIVSHAVNSARGAQPRLNWSRGALNLGALRRLDWGADDSGALRVFACHHPLFFVEGAPVEGGVRDGVAAAGMLAKARVDLVLSGHLHVPFARPLDDRDGDGWAIGAGTLSRRLRGAPAGFTTIIAEPDVFEVAALGWNGEVFETWRSWRLPRSV